MTIERLLEAGRALEAGRLDQAERIYRQVADVDPRSSIAVVGLARVALGRGEADEAVRLAEAALGIDPANAAARRLIRQHNERSGPEVGASRGSGAASDADTNDDDAWPWPGLERELARHDGARRRAGRRGLLGRLLGRGEG